MMRGLSPTVSVLSSDGEVLEGPLTEDDAIVEAVEKALLDETPQELVARHVLESLQSFLGDGGDGKSVADRIKESSGVHVVEATMDEKDPTLVHFKVQLSQPLSSVRVQVKL
jgi:hypothetical protein